jgi:hypothetical protein
MIMEQTCFKKMQWNCVPVCVIIALVAIAALVFALPVFGTSVAKGHAALDELHGVFVYTPCTVFWW